MKNTSNSHGLWRNNDFVLLLSGQVVSSVGDQVQSLALPLVVLLVTGSATQAGILLGLQTAAYLVFGLVAGALVDRWNRKTVMIWCEIGRALLTVSVPAAIMLNILGIGQLYVVAILSGVLTTLFQTANAAALPNVVAPSMLPGALGTLQASFSAVGIAGASVAGLLYTLGRTVPFFVNAASFCVSAITLSFMRSEFQAERTVTPGRIVEDIHVGLTWVWKQPVIRFLTFVQAADNLRYGAGYLLIIVLAQHVGSNPFQIGLIFSGAAVGALLGGLASGRVARRFPLGAVALVMLWIEALAFPLYAIAPNWWLIGSIALVESIVAPMYTVAMSTYRLSITPDALRGRVSGAVGTVTTGAMSLGAIIGGVLLTTIGPVVLAIACGVWLLVLAIVTTANRAVREAPVAAARVDKSF